MKENPARQNPSSKTWGQSPSSFTMAICSKVEKLSVVITLRSTPGKRNCMRKISKVKQSRLESSKDLLYNKRPRRLTRIYSEKRGQSAHVRFFLSSAWVVHLQHSTSDTVRVVSSSWDLQEYSTDINRGFADTPPHPENTKPHSIGRSTRGESQPRGDA